MFIENLLFWGAALLYDIIVTLYIRYLYLFSYVWKEETHSYTMVPIRHIWGLQKMVCKDKGQNF